MYLPASKSAIACGTLLTFSTISIGVASKNLIVGGAASFNLAKRSATFISSVNTISIYSPSE